MSFYRTSYELSQWFQTDVAIRLHTILRQAPMEMPSSSSNSLPPETLSGCMTTYPSHAATIRYMDMADYRLPSLKICQSILLQAEWTENFGFVA